MSSPSTLDASLAPGALGPGAFGPTARVPGAVVVVLAGAPHLRAIALGGGSVLLGRGDPGSSAQGPALPDDRVSRAHVRLTWTEDGFRVEDQQSRNGTFVDGRRVEGSVLAPEGALLRIGGTLMVLASDVRPYVGATVAADDLVIGPVLRQAIEDIARAAVSSDVLFVRGESGAGKEHAARVFHDRGPNARGPFVAVNAAAIPEGVAERLLFGARRGAFSGAVADAEGYALAADGGVLFLDEVGELSLDVQAKLLRFLETREVLALGASRPKKVNVRICCATHRDLRAAVAEGRFRADLYYRLTALEVSLPPLRARREEIPVLVQRALAAVRPPKRAHVSFFEACLTRPWPGNVRELFGAVRKAVHAAGEDETVTAQHLPVEAGLTLAVVGTAGTAAMMPSEGATSSVSEASPAHGAEGPSAETPGADTREVDTRGSGARVGGGPDASREERARILEALARAGGNQTLAAEALGMSRRTLIRRLEAYDLPRPRVRGREGGSGESGSGGDGS